MNGFYWIASYPKSGSTWFRIFLESLLSGGGLPDINALRVVQVGAVSRSSFDCIMDIESSELTEDEITNARPRQYEIEAREASAPLFRKVHDAWRYTPSGEPLFPPELTLGAVHLIRDPRDIAVSLAYHLNKTVDFSIERMADPDGFAERSCQRIALQLPQQLLSWSMHAQSWLEAPIPKLLLRYEDMLADPVASFTKAAEFLGIEATGAEIAVATDAVRFDRLQKQEEAVGFVERRPGTERFFRRGIAGGWRDSLSKEQIARIESDHGPMMHKLGYL